MLNITVDINLGLTHSAYIEIPFDQGKELLEKEGYRIISLKENAQLRMQEGKDAFVSKNGNWTREGVLYVPNKGVFLTKSSLIVVNAQEAIHCHRNEQEFYLTDAQVQESLADSVEILGNPVPTNRFAENPITVYAFEDQADQYGQFLRNAGIKEMPIWLANLEDKPSVRQMRFLRLTAIVRSSLRGYGCLNCGYRVRGIKSI